MSGFPISDEVRIIGNLAGGMDLRTAGPGIRLASPVSLTGSYSFSFPQNAGTTGQYLTLTSPTTSEWGSGQSGALETWYIKDIRSPGTNGGSDTNGGTRPLNTLLKRPGVGTDIQLAVAPAGANQILVQPGTYMVKVYTPTAVMLNMGFQLVDVTNGVNLIVSSNDVMASSDYSQTTCLLLKTIVVNTQIVVELQATFGGGTPSSLNRGISTGIAGVDEVYTQMRFVKIQ